MIVSSVPVSASVVVAGTPKRYCGFALSETASGAARVRIWDGTTATGTVLDELTLAAGGSAREYYPDGIKTTVGIYVQVVSGAVTGAVRVEA